MLPFGGTGNNTYNEVCSAAENNEASHNDSISSSGRFSAGLLNLS